MYVTLCIGARRMTSVKRVEITSQLFFQEKSLD